MLLGYCPPTTDKTFSWIIPISTDVKEAYGAGKPIHKFNNKVPATTAYIDLGRSVVKKIRQLKGQVSDERS
jgi:cellulose biosynthesis protein BcsQ